MFDVPESDIVGVRVDEEAVKINKCPEYIRSRSTTSTDGLHESLSTSDENKNTNDNDNKISMPTDFYQLTNSTSDFKSRSNDVFDKLTSLEKQHDIHTKNNTPISVLDDETPSSSSSSYQNPNIPSHAIISKKRPADDTFIRPKDKWKKYDLDDVNEHHLSNMGNRHALNDYLRTRVKPSDTNETEEETPSRPIFQRPIKKQIRTNDDDEDNNDDHFISVRVPLPSNTTETKTEDDNDDETVKYKLKSIRKQARGVFSTNEKKTIKPSTELFQEKNNDDDDDDNDDGDDDDDDDDDDGDDDGNDNEDVNEELFEP
ncbi:unnamed protein product [Rotaria sp. Silwood1]|nr:unnamed protein product [Rotaria sp. Silwood1]